MSHVIVYDCLLKAFSRTNFQSESCTHPVPVCWGSNRKPRLDDRHTHIISFRHATIPKQSQISKRNDGVDDETNVLAEIIIAYYEYNVYIYIYCIIIYIYYINLNYIILNYNNLYYINYIILYYVILYYIILCYIIFSIKSSIKPQCILNASWRTTNAPCKIASQQLSQPLLDGKFGQLLWCCQVCLPAPHLPS